jgi:ATP phosphoribosyltransferase
VLANDKLILALPKGRILDDVMPLVRRAGIEPEAAFDDDNARQLSFATNDPNLDIIRVRSFDIATMIGFGVAHFGVAGADVLMEFDSREIYAPLDLDVGYCRMVVAEPKDMAPGDNPKRWSHIRVATKYPEITKRHFAARGVQAECIKLNGAIEIAPTLGLCSRIVDLVSTGSTLKANGLVEVEEIATITSRLAINRTAMKTRPEEMTDWIDRFREAVHAGDA